MFHGAFALIHGLVRPFKDRLRVLVDGAVKPSEADRGGYPFACGQVGAARKTVDFAIETRHEHVDVLVVLAVQYHAEFVAADTEHRRVNEDVADEFG